MADKAFSLSLTAKEDGTYACWAYDGNDYTLRLSVSGLEDPCTAGCFLKNVIDEWVNKEQRKNWEKRGNPFDALSLSPTTEARPETVTEPQEEIKDEQESKQ